MGSRLPLVFAPCVCAGVGVGVRVCVWCLCVVGSACPVTADGYTPPPSMWPRYRKSMDATMKKLSKENETLKGKALLLIDMDAEVVVHVCLCS